MYEMDEDKTVVDWMYFVFFILCLQIMSIQSVFILRLHSVLESLEVCNAGFFLCKLCQLLPYSRKNMILYRSASNVRSFC